MGELSPDARGWLTTRHEAVLITLRADGTPHSANVNFTFDGTEFAISSAARSAKVRNLARDRRAVLHVLGPHFYGYAAVTCTATLSPVSSEAGDPTGRDLLAAYNAISKDVHPDPDEFLRDQVIQRRLRIALAPISIAGMGWQN